MIGSQLRNPQRFIPPTVVHKLKPSMKALVKIQSDGLNVHVIYKVKSKLIGRVILSMILILLLIIWTVAFSSIDGPESPKLIAGLMLPCSLSLFLTTKYLLWNSFGEELLIVNTKTVSYSYSYGIIRTNLKTISHNSLALNFKPTRKEGNFEYGDVLFINYNPATNLPELIHQTTVGMEINDYRELEKLIGELFEMESSRSIECSNFSAN